MTQHTDDCSLTRMTARQEFKEEERLRMEEEDYDGCYVENHCFECGEYESECICP